MGGDESTNTGLDPKTAKDKADAILSKVSTGTDAGKTVTNKENANKAIGDCNIENLNKELKALSVDETSALSEQKAAVKEEKAAETAANNVSGGGSTVTTNATTAESSASQLATPIA